MTFYPPLLRLHSIALTVRIAAAIILAVTPFYIQADSSNGGNSENQHQSALPTPDDVNLVLRLECLQQGASWIGCSRMAGTAYLFLTTFGDAAWDQTISEARSNQGNSDAQSVTSAAGIDASGGSTTSQRAALAAKKAAHFYWAVFTADPAVTDEVPDPSIVDPATIAEKEASALATKLTALGVDRAWAELVRETIANQPNLDFEFISGPAGTGGPKRAELTRETIANQPDLGFDQSTIKSVLDELQNARVTKWPDPGFFEIRRGYSPTTPELVKSYGKF